MLIAENKNMVSYTDLIDIIVMNQIAQKKRIDSNRAANLMNSKFDNILNQKVSKSSSGLVQQVPLKNLNIQTLPTFEMENFLSNKKGSFETAIEFVLKHEGERLVNKDGASGESSRYGILQSTASSLGYKGNIKDITKEQAVVIYEKLWDMSGAANLPHSLSIVYFDTYVNSPAMAKKLLAKSGGDINTFLNMREQRYKRLAEARPDVFGRYLKGWKNRVNNLRVMIADIERKGVSKEA
ncbi:MAG: hypothetical protein N3D15_03500 [Syntrophorhabdaceae bacterium]|nr:hypothetical protein [Syntrophorhabdaceae bacterium]